MGDSYYPAAYGGGQLDFSGIQQAAKGIAGGLTDMWDRQSLQRAVEGAGGDFNKLYQDLLAAGHAREAASVANMLEQQEMAKYRGESLDINRQELDLRREQANRPLAPTAAQRNAEYFATLPDGDPRKAYAPRNQGGRPLYQGTITALGKKGEAAFKSNELTSSFKDEFGGYKTQTLGQYANAAQRYLGAGPQSQEGATWWQNYDRNRSTTRVELFGTALTATERQDWEAADINPGMTPETIKKNLAMQDAAAKRAASKLVNVYVKQGYDPEAIEAAVGYPLEELVNTPEAPPKVQTTDPNGPYMPSAGGPGPRKIYDINGNPL
jgi:hypothetical protein